jgi:diguanylate cyclase (GGDEF)-like protein/PAS domain S-box-containing protein
MLSRVIALMRRPGRSRSGALLLACGLGIGLLLAAAAAWYGVTSRQTVIAGSVREMRNDALLLADQEDRLLQAVDAVQLGLIEHMRTIGIDSPEKFERVMASREVHIDLGARIANLPYISALSLSASGKLLNFSRVWPPPTVMDADRDFIRGLVEDDGPDTFISEPSLSKTTGKWTIYLSRRFEDPNGKLIGFVVSTIQIDFFEQFYGKLPLTGGGSFALYRRDGMLIARYPHVDPSIGKSYADTINFNHMLEVLDHGVTRITSLLDGKDRLLVPNAMAHFPLIITVSDTMDSILRYWQQQMHLLVATTLLLELMIAGTVLLAVRHLRGQDRLQAEQAARTQAEAELAVAEEHERAAVTLHMQERRFDTAVQNMPQGLIMLDDAGKVLAINRTFCESAGVPMELLPLGTSNARLVEVILAAGRNTPEDLNELRRRREELFGLGPNARASFVWERSDGQVFTVTYQRVEEGWLTTHENITERRAAEARIAHMARHDALTGLPNRALFHETLDNALAMARRGHLVALHCLDLDQFKTVNDTLGHPVGDTLLRQVAQRLLDGVRETDTVARLGGDEFAIVQTMIDSPLDATALARRINELIETPFEIDSHQIVIGTSIGIAFAPQDGVDADLVLKCADLALYRAKEDGRGVYRLFQAEMDAAIQARRVLELELRQALPNGQLELFYQPQINVRGGWVAGCEALLRWRHPSMGLVSPNRFIGLAEETGVIVPIGEWVLRQACITASTWPEASKIAVNVSAVQFRNHNLVGTVIAALRESGLSASRLELEITETVMLQDTDATLATLHQLRELGVQIAMDDFGTGYSSLSYLRRFRFDRIKIDQTFIRELGKRDDCIAIVRAVIALGCDLGMAITAEGVETRQQLEMLERAGCDEIQGYLFSRPVPEAAVIPLLRSMPVLAEIWPAPGRRVLSRPVETLEHRPSDRPHAVVWPAMTAAGRR